MLDPRLYTFLTLCEQMSYTKTARVLSMTQPAVTQHIQYLEQQYGVRLFIYEGRRLSLTPEGAFLQSAVTTLAVDAKRIAEKILLVKEEKRQLRLGATLTIGEFVAPAILESYMVAHPEVRLSMVVANTAMLLGRLQSGELDAALIEGYFDRHAFAAERLQGEAFIAVAAAGDPLVGRRLTLDALLPETLIIREPGSGTREILERALGEANLHTDHFKEQIVIGNMNAIKRLVAHKLGITFLYRSAATEELERGTLVQLELEDFAVTHAFHFVTLEGSQFSRDHQDFCTFWKQQIDRTEQSR